MFIPGNFKRQARPLKLLKEKNTNAVLQVTSVR